jgi:lantibiotic transport system ATP-binding protein
MTNAIEFAGAGKRFGARWAVTGLDLTVAEGTVFGFLGPNGAGKTTTIRLMLGLLRPTTGRIRVFGHDVVADRMAAARQVGSLLEARATYDNLTRRENLDSTRRLLGLPVSEIDRVLALVEMSNSADRTMGHYSLGMRQRLGLARALLGHPRLLVLDEPMNGLDPDGMRDMRAVIRDLPARSGVTIFLSSHLLAEVQQTATHIGLMQEGRLVLQGPLQELLQRTASELHVKTRNQSAAIETLTRAGYDAHKDGDAILVTLARGDSEAAAVNKTLVAAGHDVFELSLRPRTLESLYMQTQSARAA